MDPEPEAPWQPDRRWADPLIATLILLILLLAGLTLQTREDTTRRPSERASLQARLAEVYLAGPGLLNLQGKTADWSKTEASLTEPWDRALLAVLKAESGEGKEAPPPSAVPKEPGGDAFRQVCLAAYAGGPVPDRPVRDEVRRRLGNGYAADLLEARMLDREGGGGKLRAQARESLMKRVAGLALLGLAALGLAAGGLAMGAYLLATRRQPLRQPLPSWGMSGRAAALVFLAWFLAFFLTGNLAALLLRPWPAVRWLALPLGYALHAAFGIRLLCWAEGVAPAALRRRLAPGRMGRDLAWGLAFLALAVFLVILAALVTNLILQPDQNPQRELQDLIRSLPGPASSLALFLTVAGLAPLFEELFFRGFLLPILARKGRTAWALAASALLFGAIHLQPMGLPVLATLGFAMGLAMRHTGSLRTPILVHACWNGGLFLLMRAFA